MRVQKLFKLAAEYMYLFWYSCHSSCSERGISGFENSDRSTFITSSNRTAVPGICMNVIWNFRPDIIDKCVYACETTKYKGCI